MDETLQTALLVASILDDLQVRWFLGGSLASSLRGIPRATLDADMVAELLHEHVKPLLEALGEVWYADEQAIHDAISNRSSFNLIHFDTAMKVDVFVPKQRRFETEQFARAVRTPVADGSEVEVPVCSAEDIIAVKLEWFRLGQELSERQWGDILGVLRVNEGQLDLEQLRQSAQELGVADNTVVIFLSDNGDPRRISKNAASSRSIRAKPRHNLRDESRPHG